MPIDITMPALSPTMETGTLAKWLVKVGDAVKSGDILCEIETDKATMEVEAVDEGTVAELLVADGAEDIPVGQPIARLTGEGEEAAPVKVEPAPAAEAKSGQAKPPEAPPPPASTGGRFPSPSGGGAKGDAAANPPPEGEGDHAQHGGGATPPSTPLADRVNASPLARRLAAAGGVDLAGVKGSGPNGRIVKADVEGAGPALRQAQGERISVDDAEKPASAEPVGTQSAESQPPKAQPTPAPTDIPSETVKLSNMRKTIARRLTESKQQIPHIYLTVDINLDKLLKLRTELNAGLEARKVKLSVNDMLIKALAAALIEVPACNVSFAGDSLIKYSRADISVAVSIPNGLITPIITGANLKSLSAISAEMGDLAARARDGKLKPEEYQGGTASLSNMGMYGIRQFEAVINPPQAMIMAIGAGEKRPYVVNDALAIATVMSATGSFDHRAIDGADGAALVQAFKRLCENPLAMLA